MFPRSVLDCRERVFEPIWLSLTAIFEDFVVMKTSPTCEIFLFSINCYEVRSSLNISFSVLKWCKFYCLLFPSLCIADARFNLLLNGLPREESGVYSRSAVEDYCSPAAAPAPLICCYNLSSSLTASLSVSLSFNLVYVFEMRDCCFFFFSMSSMLLS